MNDVELIRCPSCRGRKEVAKLGGMMGKCNECKGKGEINAVDKIKAVAIEIVPVEQIKKAVAEAIPFEAKDKPFKGAIVLDSVECKAPEKAEVMKPEKKKIDGKKAIFKRKKA